MLSREVMSHPRIIQADVRVKKQTKDDATNLVQLQKKKTIKIDNETYHQSIIMTLISKWYSPTYGKLIHNGNYMGTIRAA
jgi:hypothetical protein